MSGELGFDTRSLKWEPRRRPGIFGKFLRGDPAADHTVLLKLDPGVHYPRHLHPSGEELFVIEGRIRIEDRWYEQAAMCGPRQAPSTTCSLIRAR